MDDDRIWQAGTRRFRLTMATDVSRDGMGLELVEEVSGSGRRAALEVFHWDETGEFVFSADRVDDLPLDLIDRFLTEARRRLPLSS